MFGRVDRGGSREGKKSLRKNKIAIKDASKAPKKDASAAEAESSAPASPIATKHENGVIDSCCNLVNRKLENDIGKVLNRASQAGVDAMIIFSSDYDKQEQVLALAKQNTGVTYACIGIHPDNIKRTNEKQIQQRLELVHNLGLEKETVAVLCGLDYSREIATHFAQQKLFASLLDTAAQLELPIIVMQNQAEDAVLAQISQAQLPSVGLFNFVGTPTQLQGFLDLPTPVYFIVTGLCTVADDPVADAARAVNLVLPLIPVERLLVATNAPFLTPTNIKDDWLREMPNEPSNIPFIVQALAAIIKRSPHDLLPILRANSKTFFKLFDMSEAEHNGEEEAEGEAPAEEEAAAAEEEAGAVAVTEKKAEVQPVTAPAVASASSETVRYACKSCRAVLVSRDDVQNHLPPAGSARGDELCQQLFIKPSAKWIQAHEKEGTEGKLNCIQCGAKVGRWSSVAAIECTCGTFSSRLPAYLLKKKSVDMLLPLSQMRDASLQRADPEAQDKEDEAAQKPKKGKKGKAKQRRDNTANFSSFRNKDYKPKGGKDGGGSD